MNPIHEEDLASIARQIRAKVVEMSYRARGAHLASALSAVDILVAAYWRVLSIDAKNPASPDRDRFIFSKGHASSALYATLAKKNFFPAEILETYGKKGSKLAEQPSPRCVPGLEFATGSLGHGLGVGIGMAMAARIQNRSYKVYVLMSDGECNEGSVWESALFAPAQKLERLAAIIDYNKWQATGRSNEVMALAPLKEKWQAFGWSAYEVDGHDLNTLEETLKNVPDGSGKPVAIIANTIKGKGVSFMEDDNNWHYRSPDEKQWLAAQKELGVS